MKLYNVFVGKPRWELGWPYFGFDNEKLKVSILERLRRNFPVVEFLGGDLIDKYDGEDVKKIKEAVKNSDGLIIHTIGHYGDPGPIKAAVELIELENPTILANYTYAGDLYFVQIYSQVKMKKVRLLPISSPNFEDVQWAVNIMYKLYELKGKRILNYTLNETRINVPGGMELIKPEMRKAKKEFMPYIEKLSELFQPSEGDKFYIDLVGVDQAHQWRRDEGRYKKTLAEVFDMEMIRPDPEEICNAYEESDENEAKQVADKWIKKASDVTATYEAIVNSAKLYLAMKKLMEKYDADAITVDCGTLVLTGYLPAVPCFPFHQLWNEGSVGVCESDMDCSVSALLGKCLTGRPGFTSNHSYDLANNRITYLHCMISNKLYGVDGPSQEYEIVKHGEGHILGAAVWLDFPVGETVTTIKVSVLEKKIAIRSGKIVGSSKDEKACRAKMVVETNVARILENYDYQAFGWHRESFLGDWRRECVAAAKLLGLDIVEEDV